MCAQLLSISLNGNICCKAEVDDQTGNDNFPNLPFPDLPTMTGQQQLRTFLTHLMTMQISQN
jgi:hypothetical protein